MFSITQKTRIPIHFVAIKPIYRRIGRATSARDCSLTTSSRLESIDLSKIDKSFKISDFSVQNLVSIGADKLLTERKLSFNDVDGFVAGVTDILNENHKSDEA